MHAIFLLYGKYELVNQLIRDITAQKFPIRFYKEGEPDRIFWIDCQLRLLPFGFYDFIFPKEFMNEVLTTLNFQDKTRVYDLDFDKSYFGFKPFKIIKDFLQVEEIPKFNTNAKMPWMTKNVTIVSLGVKYDSEIEETQGPEAGFKHERL